MISTDLGVWVGAILSLFCLTYYISEKQSIFFRFAQSTVVGTSIGYVVVLVMIKTLDSLVITRVARGELIYILPFIIGLMFYLRFVPGYSYLSRFPIALIVGTGLGLAARANLETDIFKHVLASAELLISAKNPIEALNSIIFIVGLVSGIFYFYFTLSEKAESQSKMFSKMGRYFLLFFLGQRYGGTIMYRTNLILGRLQFILFDWLGFG